MDTRSVEHDDGQRLARPRGHVTFVTRPHTSPKEGAVTSNADDVNNMAVTASKSDLGFGKMPRAPQAKPPEHGTDGGRMPTIRIWDSESVEQSIQNKTGIVSDVAGNNPKERSRPLKTPARQKSKESGTAVSGQDRKKVHHVIHHGGGGELGDNRELPGAKFARILKGLRIIVGFCLAVKRCAQKRTATSVSSLLNELEDRINDTSTFNVIDFNLDRLKESGLSKPVKHLGHRLRSILYIPPEKRSKEDVRKIFVFLRMLPTFKNWTVVILLNFCRYAVYQKYQPKQVILKRGHYPEGYYIILSGRVLVSEWVSGDGDDTKRSTYELTCGDIFGEKELVDNTPRQITVVCRTECELLTASREDYLEVVLRPMQKIMDENIRFLRKLRLFEHFPCHKLSEALAEYSVKLYSKDTVIVPASDLMNNLIIIKTGKCKVVGEITEKNKRDNPSVLDLELRRTFPKEYERRHGQELQRAHTSLELEWQTGEMRGVMKANLLMGIRDPDRLIVSAGQRRVKEKNSDSWTPSGYGLNRLYEKMETTKAKLQRSKTDLVSVPDPKSDPVEESLKDTTSSGSRHPSATKKRKTKRLHTKKRQDVQPSPGLELGSQQLTGRERHDNKPHFVVIDTLGPGSVFGLETVFSQCPLRLSLVSEGAECISISKSFFIRESNLKVLNAASDVIIRYPSIAYIRKQVEDRRRWERYKKRVVQEVIQPRLLSRDPTKIGLS